MIRFTAAQIDACAAARRAAFARSLAGRLLLIAPDLAATLNEEDRRAAALASDRDARATGFTLKGPLRMWFDLGAALGSGFHDDPQYPAVAAALAAPQGDQMSRAEAVHAAAVAYLRETDGPENRYTLEALAALRMRLDGPIRLAGPTLERTLLAMMADVHPRKVAASGEDAVARMIGVAVANARDAHGMDEVEGQALMATLAFCFGHAADRDPLLPWIARTLARDAPPATKAETLRRKATVWLDAVLARRGGGG